MVGTTVNRSVYPDHIWITCPAKYSGALHSQRIRRVVSRRSEVEMNRPRTLSVALFVSGAIAAVVAAAAIPPIGVAEEVAQVAPPAPPMNALSVEPRVPRLGVTPCVVELFRDLRIDDSSEEGLFDPFEYVPPAGCPGPWAKIILSVDMSGPYTTSYRAHLDNFMISLGERGSRDPEVAVELMVATPQINEHAPRWRVERDVTDYSALFHVARTGFARNTDNFFRFPCGSCTSVIATARLIFYPASALVPAPEVPDVVLPAAGFAAGALPRNIERAYLDVYVHRPQEAWFSCVPRSAASQYPILVTTPLAMGDVENPHENNAHGCQGATYFDAVARVDLQPAGVATPYPWLGSDMNLRFENSVDVPVPTPQSINLMPVRVDITPFAALLSDGAAHGIGFVYDEPGGMLRTGPSRMAQLLLYLDEGSQQVTGALTVNTLATGTPTTLAPVEATEIRNVWSQQGDMLNGDVENHYRRRYEIAGYVNTSRGRIDTWVTHEHVLTNVQQVRVDDMSNFEDHTYAQNLDFVSTTDRSSLRVRATQVLALDRERYHYPLTIDWQASGGAAATHTDSYVSHASAAVIQGHHQQRSFYRPQGTYANRLYANFAGSRTYDAITGTSSNWYGARSHYFHDSAGSCFRERVTWLRTALTSHTQGDGCPEGRNRVRGFAHPDGSSESLGWLR